MRGQRGDQRMRGIDLEDRLGRLAELTVLREHPLEAPVEAAILRHETDRTFRQTIGRPHVFDGLGENLLHAGE